MLPVQPVQGFEGVQDLLLAHAGAPQPLQQIYLLNSEARLLAELGHPAARRTGGQRVCVSEGRGDDKETQVVSVEKFRQFN